MTDMQVRYRTLKETERSNRVNEAIKQIEANSKVALNSAQIEKIKAEIPKIEAEIASIKANTELSQAQKNKMIADTANGRYKFIEDITGVSFARDVASSFLGGMGSAVGKGLIG